MTDILYVGLGSFFGGILRFGISKLSLIYFHEKFSIANLTANFIGCFLVAVFYELLTKNIWQNNNLKLFFIIGFCGGLTTFSSYILELFHLGIDKNYPKLITYILLTNVGGLFFFISGLLLVKSLFK